MGKVMVTGRVMPSSVEEDMQKLEEEVKKVIINSGGELLNVEVKPIAFGLNALNIIFLIPDEEGFMGKIEEDIAKISGVESFEVVDLRRTL